MNVSIKKFEQKCELSGIEYRVHEESDSFKIDDFIKETRFTDLVVISQKLFFRHVENDQPNNYMKQVLHTSECPVLIIPEDYSPATHVTLSYDGKKESMFAIKQFCYLFPNYTSLPTEVAYWVDKSDDEIPDIEYLEEFAARHFSNLNFKEHYFNPKKYMDNWAHENRSEIFVFGSYKRSWLSNLFKKSFGDEMIKHSSAILFIAHNC